MKLIPHTERLYEIPMGYVKAFLIRGDKELVLIDTGIQGQADRILTAVKKAGMNPENLKHILLTQLHTDHVGSLAELKDKTGARVYAHKMDADAIEEGRVMRDCIATPSLISRLFVPLILRKGTENFIKGTKVDVRLNHGDFLDLAGGITVIHTPGHTAGHVCYLLSGNKKIMIMGDVASGGRHPGYPMLFEDEKSGFRSLSDLGDMDFEMAFFAHGRAIKKDAALEFKKRFQPLSAISS